MLKYRYTNSFKREVFRVYNIDINIIKNLSQLFYELVKTKNNRLPVWVFDPENGKVEAAYVEQWRDARFCLNWQSGGTSVVDEETFSHYVIVSPEVREQ